VVNKDFHANNLKEFSVIREANAAKLSFGSGGAGSSTHLGCVLLNSTIGVDVQHVPYRGSAPALQDLVGGRINYLCDAALDRAAQIKAGAVKPIAVLGAQNARRWLPDVPTAQEQGNARLRGQQLDRAVRAAAHAGIGSSQHLHDATIEAMSTPAVRDRMGGDRYRFGGAGSHQLGLPQALRRQRDQEVGGADQGERRVGRLTGLGSQAGRRFRIEKGQYRSEFA